MDCFEGAWNPYVRNFDPTLNQDFMHCDIAPRFDILNKFYTEARKENETVDISTIDAQEIWLETKGAFLDNLKDTLILFNDNETKWICLTKYCGSSHKNPNTEKVEVWSWLYAYFVSSEQADALFECAENGRSVIMHDTASHHEIYSVFNREYPWSPSCRKMNEYAWVDVKIKTGECEIVTETIPVQDDSLIENLLHELPVLSEVEEQKGEELMEDEEDLFEIPDIQFEEKTRKQEIEKEIGYILHATTNLIGGGEYDATQENSIPLNLPCAELIETMNLRQQYEDVFYYDLNGELAAFDTNLTQNINSVVVRKDILDAFLDKTEMILVWLVKAQKEIHEGDYSISKWSDWEAAYVYKGDDITGDIRRMKSQER